MTTLRSLGTGEKFYYDNNMNYTNTFIAKSSLNFCDNKDLVNRAIKEWKNNNDLLRSHVISEYEDKKFAFFDEKLANKNVFYQCLKMNEFCKLPAGPDFVKELLSLLSNNEAYYIFKSENNYLWRLIFLRLVSLFIFNFLWHVL